MSSHKSRTSRGAGEWESELNTKQIHGECVESDDVSDCRGFIIQNKVYFLEVEHIRDIMTIALGASRNMYISTFNMHIIISSLMLMSQFTSSWHCVLFIND